MARLQQQGVTLIVSLIMLVVLTLLVVSAIRFGGINLRIANNAQVEAEAAAASHVAIERTIELINAADRPSDVAAQNNVEISTGGATYKVNVTKPACVLSRNIYTTELDQLKEADQPCYEGAPKEVIFDSNGNPIPQPTACKDQQWDFTSTLNDTSSGAKVTMLQGVAMRVSAEVSCP